MVIIHYKFFREIKKQERIKKKHSEFWAALTSIGSKSTAKKNEKKNYLSEWTFCYKQINTPILFHFFLSLERVSIHIFFLFDSEILFNFITWRLRRHK